MEKWVCVCIHFKTHKIPFRSVQQKRRTHASNHISRSLRELKPSASYFSSKVKHIEMKEFLHLWCSVLHCISGKCNRYSTECFCLYLLQLPWHRSSSSSSVMNWGLQCPKWRHPAFSGIVMKHFKIMWPSPMEAALNLISFNFVKLSARLARTMAVLYKSWS